MRTGDKVVVKIRDLWNRGTIVECRPDDMYMVGVGEPHYFNYSVMEFHASNIKRFVELPEEEEAAKCKTELAQAWELVRQLMGKFLPDETVEIKDDAIYSAKWGVALESVVYETSTIGVVTEVFSWQVNVACYTHATRDQPEHWDVVDVAPPSNWSGAAEVFIETIFHRKLDALQQE